MEKIVLKLGGSVITRKEVGYFPLTIEKIKKTADKYIRLTTLNRLVDEILAANTLPLIVINGVGPFGHYLVNNWHLLPKKEIVHQSVAYLNSIIVNSFKTYGLPIDCYAPFETCYYAGNGNYNIEKLFSSGERTLKQKKILSTYGDIVPVARGVEGKYGMYEVISGDCLVVLLAKLWNADKIIMATDVDGVYDKNPKVHKNARLLKEIKIGQKLEISTDDEKIDATGTMSGKIKNLLEAAQIGIKSQIVNGFKKDNVKNALLGDESIGTLILP